MTAPGNDRATTHETRIREIRANKAQHAHATLEELSACCMVGGALDLGLLDAHRGTVGPTDRCDVRRGPCGCGAWH